MAHIVSIEPQSRRDLIELTRLESTESGAPRDFVDVAQMLGDIQREFKGRKNVAKITVHTETDAALLGSESELHSIFYNLISNAVRYNKEKGKVTVSLADEGARLVLEVADEWALALRQADEGD